METKVVNLRTQKYDVYIGRAGHGQNGYFGNPYKDGTKQENVNRYRQYFNNRIKEDKEFRQNVMSLKGKVLGCFCKNNPTDLCHGDIIVDYLNNLEIKPLIYGIVGSRGFRDYTFMKETLKWFKFKAIVSGGANGADSLAERFAKENKIQIEVIKPEWDRLGKSAAFIRNEQIVRKSDEIIAFWDGISRGTKNTIDKAEQLGKPVHIFWSKREESTYDEIAEL